MTAPILYRMNNLNSSQFTSRLEGRNKLKVYCTRRKHTGSGEAKTNRLWNIRTWCAHGISRSPCYNCKIWRNLKGITCDGKSLFSVIIRTHTKPFCSYLYLFSLLILLILYQIIIISLRKYTIMVSRYT